MISELLRVREAIERKRIDKAIKIAEKIRDSYWRSYALKWIAQELAKDDPKKAREIALSIPIISLRRDALLYVTYELAEVGKFRDAVETAKMIEDKYTKRKAFRKISTEIAEILKKSNLIEVNLSDLGLDEEDIPLLEPLPEGIKYEKGKLILTEDVSIVKGIEEESNEVVEVGEPSVKRNVVTFEERRGERINLEDLPEPFRSSYLEELGLRKIEEGKLEEAVKILEELKVGGPLPRLLFFVGKCNDLRKVVRPIDRLLLVYKAFLLYDYEEAFSVFSTLFLDLMDKNPWKLLRLLKFLSFELLSEGKRRGNKKINRGLKKAL